MRPAFTDFGKNPGSPDARSRLFDEVNKDVLILVYIGIASCEFPPVASPCRVR